VVAYQGGNMPRSEQGVLADRYKVIPRSLIFIFRGEEVLLIRGAPNKRLWANRYNGIGGHIEYGEDILCAAQRELFEETGLNGIIPWLCGVILVDASPQTGICIFIFKGEYDQGEVRDSQEGKSEWVPGNRISEYALVEDLYTLLPRVISTSPGDAPFSGRYFYDDEDKLQIQFFGS
jgi:8-oxo-dGTP diphosphatase